MKTRLSIATVGLLVGLIVAGFAAGAQPQAGAETADGPPKIVSPEPVYDFGEVDHTKTITHGFVVRNVGGAPLDFTAKRTCGCTELHPEKGSIAPGEEEVISATLSIKGKQGPQTKAILVKSNDPETPVYTLKFTGVALAPVVCEPIRLDFGRVEDDKTHTQSLVVRAVEEGITFNIIDATLRDLPGFEVSHETVDEGKAYKAIVRNAKPMPPGQLRGHLIIRTDFAEKPVFLVGVYARVIGELEILPPKITLHYQPDSEKRTTQHLRVLPGRSEEFVIRKAVAPIEDMQAEVIPRQANDYLIKVADMPSDETLDGKELLLRTNLEHAPEIAVPFEVRNIPRAASPKTATPQSPAPE